MQKHYRTRQAATRLALILLLVGGLAAAPTAAGKFRDLPHAYEVPRLAELLRAGDELPRERYDFYLHEGEGRAIRLAIEVSAIIWTPPPLTV